MYLYKWGGAGGVGHIAATRARAGVTLSRRTQEWEWAFGRVDIHTRVTERECRV
jgi:hypothetical protein